VDWQAHDDSFDSVLADQCGQCGDVSLGPLALEHLEWVGDGGVWVGQSKPDASAAEVDPEDSHGVENSHAAPSDVMP
jgi:hypothetical protein